MFQIVMRFTRFAALIAAVAVTVAALAGVAGATTQPSPYMVIRVSLSDSGIKLSKGIASGVTYVVFDVVNLGKITHNLVIGNQHTSALKPGQKATFAVSFVEPGIYVLKSTLHPKTLKTSLRVKYPVRPD
jgi:uncharacterized cupredoxin-like copper-binding protein